MGDGLREHEKLGAALGITSGLKELKKGSINNARNE